MNGWLDSFYNFISGAALLLASLGLWCAVVMPSIDRWSKRFFLGYFIVLMLCCLSGIAEMILIRYPVPGAVIRLLLSLEGLLLSPLLPLLTVYLLHCCREKLRESMLFCTVLGLWAVDFVLFAAAAFSDAFCTLSAHSVYRGPWYPLLLLPMPAISLLTLVGAIQRRGQLSHKAFLSFLIALLPVTLTLSVDLFVDIYPLVVISYALSAVSMFILILSDQIEQDRRYQQEIILQQKELAHQQGKIAEQQREIAHERASTMVLRMRPHFIYNTLMSIYSLCRLDPQKARQITMDFTNYLRRNFDAVASDSAIPFATELEHTRAYLAVEQARHDDMLVVVFDTPFTQFRLPPLTLQPIVENAVKHGMDPDSDPLCISVWTRRTNSDAEIIVEDNGPGFDPSDESKPHTALENTRQRLEMMCGGTLEITSREAGGTRVIIRVPLKNSE